MTREELASTLRCLQSALEDLEETISFNLTYSSAHIGGGQVRKDEESLKEIRDKIAYVRQLLEGAEAQ
jgi:hypothetical protein